MTNLLQMTITKKDFNTLEILDRGFKMLLPEIIPANCHAIVISTKQGHQVITSVGEYPSLEMAIADSLEDSWMYSPRFYNGALYFDHKNLQRIEGYRAMFK